MILVVNWNMYVGIWYSHTSVIGLSDSDDGVIKYAYPAHRAFVFFITLARDMVFKLYRLSCVFLEVQCDLFEFGACHDSLVLMGLVAQPHVVDRLD